jgi:hypothetical protein
MAHQKHTSTMTIQSDTETKIQHKQTKSQHPKIAAKR